jgi:hypothetical protein
MIASSGLCRQQLAVRVRLSPPVRARPVSCVPTDPSRRSTSSGIFGYPPVSRPASPSVAVAEENDARRRAFPVCIPAPGRFGPYSPTLARRQGGRLGSVMNAPASSEVQPLEAVREPPEHRANADEEIGLMLAGDDA